MSGLYWLVLIAIAGLPLRYAFQDYSTPDTFKFLLPWYTFARDHGLGGLNKDFTNYTPFYSYLLILTAQFDGLAKPLLLIKTISFVFEFGSAVLAYRLVHFATKSETRSTVAFAVSWLAPTVLFNGALWGQADAIWTFFLLLSIYQFCRGQQGVLPFAFAVAVKAQGTFLAPFVLGVLFRRKRKWLWLASVPIVYLALALPVVIAGGSLQRVLAVYLNQANTYHSLSMNAANFWVFIPNAYYAVGFAIGLILAGVGGLALAGIIARSKRNSAEFLLLAACSSLLLMPYLLPKMHDRYFYAFELASISLACINPRYVPVAVIAQVDGVLAYMAFGRVFGFDLLLAALCNTVLVLFLLKQLLSEERTAPFPIGHFVSYTLLCVGFASLLIYTGNNPAAVMAKILFIIFCVLLPIQTYIMLKRTTVQHT